MATIPIFDGTNYESWSVKMETLFLSMDLWDTVQNGYDETNQEKRRKDAKALSRIQQGVSDHVFRHIKHAKKAKDAWDILSQPNIEGPTLGPTLQGPTLPGPTLQGPTLPGPTLPGPTLQGPTLPGPTLPGPTLPGPTLQGPTLPGPTLQGPTLQGPTLPQNRSVLKPKDVRERAASHLIVATLVATVAFTAGFTMPGGYNSNDGLNQGMAILTREAAFKAFMVTDTIAMSLSISAVLIHFYATMPDDPHMHVEQVYRAAHLIRYAVVAMVLAFATGTYAALAHSSGLAISVCVIGCLPLFFFLITRIIKYCDGIRCGIRRRRRFR